MHWAWTLVGLSALFASVAVVLALAGLGSPVFLVGALLAAAASYGCWRAGRDRILNDVYDGLGVQNPNAGDGPSEDWHRRGADGTATDGGAAAADAWAEEWGDDPWAGPWDDPDWPGDDGVQWGDPDEYADGSWGEWAGADADRDAGRWWREMDGDGRGVGDATAGRGRYRGDARAGREPGDDAVAAAREVLGVDRDADPAEIRAAFRERVKAAHPDHGGSPEAFRRVREAYEVLREHHADE